ncbi:SDR family mycofactocin-dependent oxidoreductase [Nakamurella sp. YIM 132087]|uniref:SDR family mycofactocin-dependent oxidoreductase n=1 Tax=Nakamurella alba TaxID=2665158 RepID=A0A7K1FQ57_9ACTN|nr:SDR family oxidoreductase [Nakamurella alba]MTD15489.1 SDR family mycofactocin-dependent oxidoreductase [Nakamurella alba]
MTNDRSRPWAVVTGAARGMGRAVARQLAVAGFDLLLLDTPSPDLIEGLGYRLATADELTDTVLQCEDFGAAVVALPVDVRDAAAVSAALEHVPAGRLQAAVAVAGIIGADKPAWEFTPAELDLDLSVNLHGVANLARAAVPALLHAPGGHGRFVAVVSTAGQTGLPRLAGYVAAKHAALGYIRALAADLGPHGVTANAVLPGSTRSALLDHSAHVYGLPDKEAFAPHQRLQRILEPSEIAAAVAFLASPASSAITGAAIHVDGGFVG